MPETIRLTCKEVRRRLNAFLEDLLGEEEYQALSLHLSRCAECAQEIRTIDSLSNTSKALDQVIPPPDLADTIVTQLRSQPQRLRIIELSGWEKTILVIILNVIVGVSCFLFGLFYFKSSMRSQESSIPPAVVTAQLVTGKSAPPTGAEAEVLVQTLKAILVGLGGGEEPELQAPAKTVKPFHWHLHLDSRHRPAVLAMIKLWSIKVEYGSEDAIFLSVPKAHFAEFAERIKTLSGGLENLEEDRLKKALSADTIEVSISFTVLPA